MSSADKDRDPVERLAEEFLERRRRGEEPSISEYSRKYPDLADEIHDVFPALLVLEEAGRRSVEGAAPAVAASEGGLPLRQLGDYRIVREIGRGGMGIVYEADHQALGRRVALKILPPRSALDPLCLQRFHREARAAARLHHTNIVPVFDVGTSEGLHYFAMQYIDGQSLDQVLGTLRQVRSATDASPYETPVSLILAEGLRSGRFDLAATNGVAPSLSAVTQPSELGDTPASATPRPLGETTTPAAPTSGFSTAVDAAYYTSIGKVGLQVANALAHAHAHNILHRDIKPANLLIDPEGTVWVTDFGLAKEEGTDLTGSGNVVGTLRYLAPERFKGPADARSDVYSLGLTLYELLCLRPAFDERDRNRLLKQIVEAEPVRPRCVDPHIPRDLETIVLKAMAKEPARRYGQAADLADDLQCFLGDQPIRARRVGPAERLWRWCRRNKAVAALAVFSALFLLSLAGVCLIAALWLRQARDATAAQKVQADQNFALAKKAVEDFLNKVTQDKRLTQADFHSLRKELLQSALPFYEEFTRQKSDDPQTEAERGRAYQRLGDVRDVLGETESALANFQEMLTIFTNLAERYPDVPDYHYFRVGALNRVGGLLVKLGRLTEAESVWREALTAQETLAEAHPDIANYRILLAKNHNNLGTIFYRTGRRVEADEQYQAALSSYEALARAHPEVAAYRRSVGMGHYNRGLALAELGRPVEAEAEYQASIAVRSSLCADYPAVADYQGDLGGSFCEYGNLLRSLGRYEDALSEYQKDLDTEMKLAAQFPKVPVYQNHLAIARNNFAMTLNDLGRKEESIAQHRQALALYERLAKDFPAEPDRRSGVVLEASNLASGLMELDQLAEAEKICNRGIAMGEKLVAEFPAVTEYRRRLIANYDVLAEVLRDQDRFKDAEDKYLRAVTVLEAAPLKGGAGPDWVGNVGSIYRNLACLVRDGDRPAEALPWLQKAMAALEPGFAQNASVTFIRSNLRRTFENRALTLELLGRHGEALPDWERAEELGDHADKLPCHLQGMACRARCGKESHRRVLAEADNLPQKSNESGVLLFGAARACALASRLAGKDERLADDYARCAITLLSAARGQGFFKPAYRVVMLKRQRDLAPLRTRAEYKRLLLAVEEDHKGTTSS